MPCHQEARRVRAAASDSAAPSATYCPSTSNPPPYEREGFIEHVLETDRLLSCPEPIDEERARETAGQAFDLSRSPAGAARQLAAFTAERSRHEALTRLRTSSLIIHGTADQLIPAEASRDVAACILGARYLEIAQMGNSSIASLSAVAVIPNCAASQPGTCAGNAR